MGYLKNFFKEEEGHETVHNIGLLIVGAGAIAAITGAFGLNGAAYGSGEAVDKVTGKPAGVPLNSYGGNPGDGRIQ